MTEELSLNHFINDFLFVALFWRSRFEEEKTLNTPRNKSFAVGRFLAQSTQCRFVISSLNPSVKSVFDILIQLELSAICLEQQVVVSVPREYRDSESVLPLILS